MRKLSESARRQARKQAMRDSGLARKERRRYGQNNLLQYPVFTTLTEPSPTPAADEEVNSDANQNRNAIGHCRVVFLLAFQLQGTTSYGLTLISTLHSLLS